MNFESKTLRELSTGNGSYGIPASAVEKNENLYTYLRITDINDDGTLDFSGLKSVNDENAYKYLLNDNDIVFARTGNSTGRNYFYNKKHGNFVYAGFLIKFNIDSKKINPLYIKYYCLSQLYKDWIKGFNTGSTRGNINAQTYGSMPVYFPKRSQQDNLVRILSSIDDKIELNNKINANLQKQAQALFKSWFVDFEPWGGVMPEGWREGTISELGNVVGGGTPSKDHKEYYSDLGIPWITPKDLSVDKSTFIERGQLDISEVGLRNSSATLMPKGTVLFSSRAPIGYIAIAKNEVTTNQGFKSVVPNEKVGTAYVYYLLKHILPTIESMASGSTFKEVSGSIMKSVPALIPDDDTLLNFSEVCNPLFKLQEILESENRRLTKLRDTLLPKLMSGELDVSDMELSEVSDA